MVNDDTTTQPLSIEALFLAEEEHLLRFAMKLTGNFATAQDIVQDAFLQLLHHSATVTQPRPWLFTTIRHLAYNHHRKHARVGALDDATLRQLPDPAGHNDTTQLEHDETLLLIRLCVDELPAIDRQLLKLKFDANLSDAAIAGQTGLSVGNVGYRLHHAIKKIAVLYRRATAREKDSAQRIQHHEN